MSKLKETQKILQVLGLPRAQQNEISAITFLALANLRENDPWTAAKAVRRRIHDILIFAKDMYRREYAENTRETIRRQVIHQFEQARIVDRNPDNPSLATNSPRTHYALTKEILNLIQGYGGLNWDNELKKVLSNRKTLWEVYRKKRKSVMVPVRLPSGKKLHLSPGKHNKLQADIVEQFAPRFAPGAHLVYLGDTASKTMQLDKNILEKLNVYITGHDKLPDVVLYDRNKNWIFLIEAVTSHGAVSPKRQYELEKMFKDCPAERIYISAFPDFKEFKKHISNIAWETEVWLSEIPDHLIHFNGDNFLGPPKKD